MPRFEARGPNSFRERSEAEISERRQMRATRSAERQALRQQALAEAIERKNLEEIHNLEKRIAAADRALVMANPEAQAARRERLRGLSEKRNEDAWAVAAATPIPRDRFINTSLLFPIPSGPRDQAQIVAASPQVLLAKSRAPVDTEVDAVLAEMTNAVLLAGAGDRRRRPLHHGVVSGDDMNDLADRALLLAVAAGADLERDAWVVVEHRGTDSVQGRHAHVVWVGNRDCGHGGAAVAARCWAAAAGQPEAAQAPSLGTGVAAQRDWEALPQVGERLAAAVAANLLCVPSDSSPGGLFLYKGSWSAADAVRSSTVRGKARAGALAHIFGRD